MLGLVGQADPAHRYGETDDERVLGLRPLHPRAPRRVPSCGVLWGIATHPPTDAAVVAAETAIGRKVDFVYRYHDVNDVIPDSSRAALGRRGQAPAHRHRRP